MMTWMGETLEEGGCHWSGTSVRCATCLLRAKVRVRVWQTSFLRIVHRPKPPDWTANPQVSMSDNCVSHVSHNQGLDSTLTLTQSSAHVRTLFSPCTSSS